MGNVVGIVAIAVRDPRVRLAVIEIAAAVPVARRSNSNNRPASDRTCRPAATARQRGNVAARASSAVARMAPADVDRAARREAIADQADHRNREVPGCRCRCPPRP